MARVSICRTEGCENENVPIEVMSWTDEETGQPAYPDSVVCGPCGEPAEVVEVPAEGGAQKR